MSQKKGTEAPKFVSRSVVELQAAVKKGNFFINSVAQVAQINERSYYKLLSGQSRRPKKPETLMALLGAMKEEWDPVRYPELRVLSRLEPEARWLLERLVKTGMKRRELIERVASRAQERGTSVKWSRSRVDAILRGDRPFPSREPALVELLVEVFGEAPPIEKDEEANAFGLAVLVLLAKARAQLFATGQVPPGELGIVTSALHVRDMERWEREKATTPSHATLRRMVVESALRRLAEEGCSLADLAASKKDLRALGELLLGLASTEDHQRLLNQVGARLGQPAPLGEKGDVVPLPPRRIAVRTPKSSS